MNPVALGYRNWAAFLAAEPVCPICQAPMENKNKKGVPTWFFGCRNKKAPISFPHPFNVDDENEYTHYSLQYTLYPDSGYVGLFKEKFLFEQYLIEGMMIGPKITIYLFHTSYWNPAKEITAEIPYDCRNVGAMETVKNFLIM